MPVPAYDPVKLTKLARLSVKYVTMMGGKIASKGNVQRRHTKFIQLNCAVSPVDVRCSEVPINSASKLFRNVMAMIGKLVDNVNTGNNAKKYSTIFKMTSDCLADGMKFNVYRSSSDANANEPVIASSK